MQHSLSLTPKLQAIADTMIIMVDDLDEGEVQRVQQEVATVARSNRRAKEWDDAVGFEWPSSNCQF